MLLYQRGALRLPYFFVIRQPLVLQTPFPFTLDLERMF